MTQQKHRGRLLKIRLVPEDRRLVSWYVGLIRRKYGVNAMGLNGLVLTSALHFLKESCGSHVALDYVDSSRTRLVPSPAQKGR